jgi:hypothetical protein
MTKLNITISESMYTCEINTNGAIKDRWGWTRTIETSYYGNSFQPPGTPFWNKPDGSYFLLVVCRNFLLAAP